MNDGNIRRWREGKRHNAHLKVWFLTPFSLISQLRKKELTCGRRRNTLIRCLGLYLWVYTTDQDFLDQ